MFTDADSKRIQEAVLDRITDDMTEAEKLDVFGRECAALALEKVAATYEAMGNATSFRPVNIAGGLKHSALSYRGGRE